MFPIASLSHRWRVGSFTIQPLTLGVLNFVLQFIDTSQIGNILNHITIFVSFTVLPYTTHFVVWGGIGFWAVEHEDHNDIYWLGCPLLASLAPTRARNRFSFCFRFSFAFFPEHNDFYQMLMVVR
jgi:hypothetical protein